MVDILLLRALVSSYSVLEAIVTYRSQTSNKGPSRIQADIALITRPGPVQLTKKAGESDPRLEDCRWRIEEWRVSLFAQELKTPYPVSYKRLEKLWSEITRT